VVAGAELVGVVSERDLTWPGREEGGSRSPTARGRGHDQPAGHRLAHEPVEVAARLLVDNAIGCPPVVAEGAWSASSQCPTCHCCCGCWEAASRRPDRPGLPDARRPRAGHDGGRRAGVNLLTVVTEPGPEPGTRGRPAGRDINAAPVVAALVAAGFPATGPGRPEPDER
jgi:hypothetical protein